MVPKGMLDTDRREEKEGESVRKAKRMPVTIEKVKVGVDRVQVPGDQVHDSLLVHQGKAEAFGLSPLPLPAGSFGPLFLPPSPSPPGGLRTGRDIGPLDGQHQNRPPLLSFGHLGDLGLHLLPAWAHRQDRKPLGHLLRDLVGRMGTQRQSRQLLKQPIRLLPSSRPSAPG